MEGQRMVPVKPDEQFEYDETGEHIVLYWREHSVTGRPVPVALVQMPPPGMVVDRDDVVLVIPWNV